jgi:hypothetical protein
MWFTVHYTLTANEEKFRFHIKDYERGKNWKFMVGNTITEILCKSRYGNDHLQMGQNTITIAKDSGHYILFQEAKSSSVFRLCNFAIYSLLSLCTLARCSMAKQSKGSSILQVCVKKKRGNL